MLAGTPVEPSVSYMVAMPKIIWVLGRRPRTQGRPVADPWLVVFVKLTVADALKYIGVEMWNSIVIVLYT